MANLGLSATAILLVFYLYLLVRWHYVRRPMLYLIGAAGVLFAMLGGFCAVSSVTAGVSWIFSTIGGMAAFVCAIGTCYGEKLPVNLPAGLDEVAAPPETPGPGEQA